MHSTLEHPTNEVLHQLAQRVESLEQQAARQQQAAREAQAADAATEEQLSMVVFSGELDKLLAAFVMATGGAACGMRVTMFFTFWATAALKRPGRQAAGKTLVERMFGWMLPGGFRRQKLSKMDMGGLGRLMMQREMARKNIVSLEDLVATADELGVEIKVCEMSMALMGIRPEELIDYSKMEYCGVAAFLDEASKSKATLFI